MAGFRASYDGIGELLRSPMIREEMRRRAERVKTLAEQIAPYDPEDRDLSHYRDAFRVEVEERGGRRKDRAVAHVVNDNEAALFVEYGNRNTPRHATLRKALDAARD